jgi:IS1 family transposase
LAGFQVTLIGRFWVTAEEGNSLRSISRMTGVDRNTITSLLLRTGDYCADLMDGSMRNVRCGFVECDEIWTYVGKKQRRVKEGDPAEVGDQWVFVAMDAETKLVPVYTVGKRTEETPWYFINELAERVANRIQLTTDGFVFYNRHVEDAFGAEVDFAQLVSCMGNTASTTRIRNTPQAQSSRLYPRCGSGSPIRSGFARHISNGRTTIRMQMRRFTRLTNAFSKK